MAINFPDSPSNGDTHVAAGKTFVYNSTKGSWTTTGVYTNSDVDTHLNTSGATADQFLQWSGSDYQWSASGVKTYATVDDLPLTGQSNGAQAFVTGTNRLYIWSASTANSSYEGWFNIALVNTNPSLSGASSDYALAIDGTTPTVVTLTSTDPEGVPITYSIASDTSGDIATVVQGTGANTNVFTITPSGNTAHAGNFSLTFKASDGINIVQTTSTFTLNFITIIDDSNYTTALITSTGTNNQVNNTFVDSSTNSHTITTSGNITQNTFSPYRQGGYSTYFDGTGDNLSIADDATFNFGSGDSTIEMWVYPEITGTFNLITRGTSGYSGFILSSTGLLESTNGSSWTVNITFSQAITANSWQHIAVVRNGSTITIYRNGTSIGSSAISGTVTSAAQNLTIGERAGQTNFSGYMTDLRLVKGTAVYTSAFTPPTERLTAITNTSLLTCHLPYIADGSTNGHSITVNGNTKTEPFAPYDYETYSAVDNGGSSYAASRSDGRLQTTTADVNFGTGDYTIEAWCYITDFSYGPYIIDTRTSAINEPAVSFYFNPTAQYQVYIDGGVRITGTDTAIANQWNHCALVRSGGTTTAYLNGVSQGTWADSTNYTGSSLTTIGGRYVPYSGSYYDLTGNISNFRIVKGTAVYTSNFTPPTAPLTAITNTSLLLSGTNAGIIDKSQSVKTITLNGDVKSSTTQTKYLSSSMYFDGTGDYIATDVILPLTQGIDYTIEGWFYANTITGTHPMVSQYVSGNGGRFSILVESSLLKFFEGGSLGQSISVNTDTWYHFLMCRSGTTHYAFMDGTLVGNSWTSSTNIVNTNTLIGNFATYYFDGFLQDIRITKGLARYTSNFTPPTAALQG